MTLNKTINDIYQELISNPSHEDFLRKFPLNIFWENNLISLKKFISDHPDRQTIVKQAQQTFFFSVNTSSYQKYLAVNWLLEDQRRRGLDIFSYSNDLQESNWSYEDNNVIINDRRLTPDFLRTVNITRQIIDKLTFSTQSDLTVIELGGGLGHLARTMRIMKVTKTHVIVDIPETLLFSYSFLSLNFPSAKLVIATSASDISDALQNNVDFLLVPVFLADFLVGLKFDLFINTASLGEMPNKTIRHWMEWIQHTLQPRALFTLNRFLNTISPIQHSWRWDENECSLLYDDRWDIVNWELEPPYTRCPYVDPLIARYVEICAFRISDEQRLSTQSVKVDEIKNRLINQDWWIYREGDPAMTMASNTLTPDLSMQGPLFDLWQLIRIDPSPLAYAMMLRYLRTLIRGDKLQFEEEEFYRRNFLESIDKASNVSLVDEKWIRELDKKSKPITVELVQPGATHNIVKAGENYIALSLSLGVVNALIDKIGERNLGDIVLVDKDMESLKERLEQLKKTSP